MILISLPSKTYLSEVLDLFPDCYLSRKPNSVEIPGNMEAIALKVSIKLESSNILHTLYLNGKLFTPPPLIKAVVQERKKVLGHQEQWRAERLKAWGLYLTKEEWLKYPWCHPRVTVAKIEKRLEMGWSAEQAIAVAPGNTFFDYGYPNALKINRATFRGRLGAGWTVENAITRPPVNRKESHIKLEAMGMTKGVSEWTKEPCCSVSRNTIYARIQSGWSHEMAITTPPKSGVAIADARYYSGKALRRLELVRSLYLEKSSNQVS